MSQPKGQDICIDGAATTCFICHRKICMRQQVINLALGYIESMFCLHCLAKDMGRSPAEIIESLRPYISERQCFKQSWIKYQGVEYCPDPEGCVPKTCFQLPLE